MRDLDAEAEALALSLGATLGDELPRDVEFVLIVVRGDRVGITSTLPDATARELLSKMANPPR